MKVLGSSSSSVYRLDIFHRLMQKLKCLLAEKTKINKKRSGMVYFKEK